MRKEVEEAAQQTTRADKNIAQLQSESGRTPCAPHTGVLHGRNGSGQREGDKETIDTQKQVQKGTGASGEAELQQLSGLRELAGGRAGVRSCARPGGQDWKGVEIGTCSGHTHSEHALGP